MLNKNISENCRLSWAARGLLVFLLGKPDYWKVSVAHLRKETSTSLKPTGRDGIYALLEELIAAGYIHRSQGRENGKMGEVDYLVSETPSAPLTENTEAVNPPLPAPPLPAPPLPANPTLVSIDLKQELKEPVRTKSIGASAPNDAFEAAWKAYPKREGANPKAKALSCWNKRIEEGATVTELQSGVMRYAAFCAAKGNTGTEYVMQAVRFFGTEKAYANEWAAAKAPKVGKHHDLTTKDYSEDGGHDGF
jgi:hypothetical protein